MDKGCLSLHISSSLYGYIISNCLCCDIKVHHFRHFCVPALCVPVTFEPCASRGFTYTVFPNLFDHSNMTRAEEAYMRAAKNVFNQLCQETALTYLCSLFFPKCDLEEGFQEYPCRGLCEGQYKYTCILFS